MNSQPTTDAKQLTETERTAISIESRITSLIAAVYFLITAVIVVGVTHAAMASPDDFRTLDAGNRETIRWLLCLPLATFAVGGYYLAVTHWLQGKLLQKPGSSR